MNIQGKDIQIFPCDDSNHWCVTYKDKIEYFAELKDITYWLINICGIDA